MARWHLMVKRKKFHISPKPPIILISSDFPEYLGANKAYVYPDRDTIFINAEQIWKFSNKNPTRFKHNLERVIGHETAHFETAVIFDKHKRFIRKHTTYKGQEKMAEKFSPIIKR